MPMQKISKLKRVLDALVLLSVFLYSFRVDLLDASAKCMQLCLNIVSGVTIPR